MMSDRKLETIVKFLSVLGLETDRVPTVSEYRQAYKSLFSNHPDKAGAEATAKFQEITEAASKVLEFLSANRDLQPLIVDVKDTLGRLVKSNNLIYNTDCVTFDLTVDTAKGWKEQFERLLGSPKPLPKTKNHKHPGIQ